MCIVDEMKKELWITHNVEELSMKDGVTKWMKE
jgi:hypothetical protein